MKSFSLSLFGGLLFVCVNSHSWLHCSNYHAVIDSDNGYSDDECEGYIRQWSTQWGATSFGTDRGVNYFGSDGAWCQSSFSTPIADMYDSGYPYADWYVGDTVRLVWPAKNHANYECFSNIPDTSMKLYYNPSVNPTSEITGSISDWTLLVDWQSGCTAGTDGCGFQNCPSFCDDTDKAPCYGDLEVTSDKFSSDGFYTLMWYWIFNGGTTAYTTCFEVYVHSTGGGDGTGADTPSPTTATSPVPSPTKAPTQVGDTEAPTPQPTEASSVGTDYFVQVPLCVTGVSYDEDTLIDGANSAYGTNYVDWGVDSGTKVEYNDGFNVTIETFTDYSSIVTLTAYDYSDGSSALCDSIESEFGSGTSCSICSPGDMRTYSSSYLSEEDEDSSYIVNVNGKLSIFTLIIAMAIICLI